MNLHQAWNGHILIRFSTTSLFLQCSHGWLWLRLLILDYAEYWSKYLYDSLFARLLLFIIVMIIILEKLWPLYTLHLASRVTGTTNTACKCNKGSQLLGDYRLQPRKSTSKTLNRRLSVSVCFFCFFCFLRNMPPLSGEIINLVSPCLTLQVGIHIVSRLHFKKDSCSCLPP